MNSEEVLHLKFIDNQIAKLGNFLDDELRGSTTTRIAVAFASFGGVTALEAAILAALSKGGKAEILVGLDFATTDSRALRKLFDWTKTAEGFQLFVLPPSGSSIYHPKMYLLDCADYGVIVVGSSNLTEAGLFKNAEANLVVKSRKTSSVFSDAVESFLRLKFDRRYIPDESFIQKYEEIYSRVKKRQNAQPTAELAKLTSSVADMALKLKKPKLAVADLSGWMKIVYELLPDEKFTTNEVYKHENYFKERYPLNQNIREKIRQQLQFLRDAGFLENSSKGVWRKLL